jgi:hypothetical protein
MKTLRTRAEFKAAQKAAVTAMYDGIHASTKEDICEASAWARETLTNHEGTGHLIEVTSHHALKLVVCSFAKTEWSGDHCGSPMETGSEAIVMAVCEYLCGC